MSYKVLTIPYFDRQLKRLVKKFPSLKNDFQELVTSLSESPVQGDYLGKSSYKIRLSITSKGKGKSGGARVITHILIQDNIVFLLSIYDKSEKSSISNEELKELIKLVKG
jgi:mRNA-degrading endonuclease RelE of RelBE toxin-antitoxin system